MRDKEAEKAIKALLKAGHELLNNGVSPGERLRRRGRWIHEANTASGLLAIRDKRGAAAKQRREAIARRNEKKRMSSGEENND